VTNADVVKNIAKRFVGRVKECGFKGKKRDELALEFFVGAAACAEGQGNEELTQHILRIAMLVSVRGYSEVEVLAHD
jgi:hypothetical protein